MKKSFSIYVLFVFMTFTCASLGAFDSAHAYSKATLKKMSTFISNFTESSNYNFNVQQLIQEENNNFFIDFAVEHNFINYSEPRVVEREHNGYIDSKWIKESIKKYFDYDIKQLSNTEYYKYDGKRMVYATGDGETRHYATVTEARAVAKNLIEMKGYVYHVGHDDEETKTGWNFVALAKPYVFNGKNTWSILSLTTIMK